MYMHIIIGKSMHMYLYLYIYLLFIAETDFSTTGTLNRDRTIQRQPSTSSSKLILSL